MPDRMHTYICKPHPRHRGVTDSSSSYKTTYVCMYVRMTLDPLPLSTCVRRSVSDVSKAVARIASHHNTCAPPSSNLMHPSPHPHPPRRLLSHAKPSSSSHLHIHHHHHPPPKITPYPTLVTLHVLPMHRIHAIYTQIPYRLYIHKLQLYFVIGMPMPTPTGLSIPHVYVYPSRTLALVLGNASAHPACAPRPRHAMRSRLAF